MKKILISGGDLFNYGDKALIRGTIESLRRFIPDADITMVSALPEIDQAEYGPYGVKVIKSPWYRRTKTPRLKQIANLYSVILALLTLFNCILHRIFKPLLNIPIRGGFQQYDIYVEIGTDVHSTGYGPARFYYSLFSPLFWKIINKPFVMFAETLGPYKGKLDRFLMRFICNRAGAITLREEASMGHLQELGINNLNVHVAPDPAYLFVSQCPRERVDEILANSGISGDGKLLVGISASALIYRYAFPGIRSHKDKYDRYVTLMAEIADYIVDQLDASVIFIPHNISPQTNDRLISDDICQRVKNHRRVKVLRGEYTVDELKSAIGTCQMFIGCRMHPAIAAASMYIPALAMSYSHKWGSLSFVLDKERFMVDITSSDFDQLLSEACSKIDYVWENRERISQELKQKIPEVKERALLSAELVKELLDKPSKASGK